MNESNTQNISGRFKKLQLAKTRTSSESQKVEKLKGAVDLAVDINNSVKSVALNSTIVDKSRRLEKLGKNKQEINEIIVDLVSSAKNNSDMVSYIKKQNMPMSGFGIDTKFLKLGAKDILNRVNSIPDTGTVKTIKNNEKDSPLELKTNPDVDTKEDVEQNNEKIYDYLIKNGELDIANYIQKAMEKPKPETKKVSDAPTSDDYKRLSLVNEKISKKLNEIEEGMVDEQNTSVAIPQKLKQMTEVENNQPVQQEKEGGGFLSSILKMLFGSGIADLLMKATGVAGLAVTLMKSGYSWLKKKIGGLFKNMFALAIKPFKMALAGLEAALKSIMPIKAAGKLGRISKSRGPSKPKKLSSFKTAIEKSKPGVKRLSKAKTGIFKKLLKFTKPVPFLGTLIAAGTGIYAAQDGYRHADELLGKPDKDLTQTDKLASAAGKMVEDFSFGILDARATAEKIIDWSGNNDTEPKSKLDVTKNSFDSTPVDSNMSVNDKVESLQNDVNFLQQELKSADLKNNESKFKNISDSIKQKEQEIQQLSENVNGSVGKSVASKNKQLQITEKAYQGLVANTKQYDNSKMTQQPAQKVNPIINSINGNSQESKKPSAFELFEQF